MTASIISRCDFVFIMTYTLPDMTETHQISKIRPTCPAHPGNQCEHNRRRQERGNVALVHLSSSRSGSITPPWAESGESGRTLLSRHLRQSVHTCLFERHGPARTRKVVQKDGTESGTERWYRIVAQKGSTERWYRKVGYRGGTETWHTET